MLAFLRLLAKRILALLVTMLITTAVLYGIAMLTPVGARAELFLPKNLPPHLTDEQYTQLIQLAIQKNHLGDPYPVQYFYWLKNLLQGNWGYSYTLNEGIYEAIMRRAPVTAELTLYSILLFLPLGLLAGVIAGSRQGRGIDHCVRLAAYIATSLPPFILALILLAFFYVDLYWFAPERLGDATTLIVNSAQFHTYTGLLTLDGLLNGQPNVSLDALRHLMMPVITLTLPHWATLARITRAAVIEEQGQDYTVAAKARGLSQRQITWHHVLPNAIAPALTSSVLSVASLVSGVFVVEIIFGFHGLSEIAVSSMQSIIDPPAALGFIVYSVFVVSLLMAVLDLIQSALNPRLRGSAN